MVTVLSPYVLVLGTQQRMATTYLTLILSFSSLRGVKQMGQGQAHQLINSYN